MLTHLSIRNIVLIEHCDLALDAGFTVMTGETGAGKSILLEALGLVLGSKPEGKLLLPDAASGSVSATFDLRNHAGARAALAALELAQADELILRRTLAADGKGKCFVNDEPVSVAALKIIGAQLCEIQGQHTQGGMSDASTQMALLDRYGAHEALRREVEAAFALWRTAKEEMAALQEAIALAQRDEEYLRHMVAELSTLGPEEGEEERLSEERARLQKQQKAAHAVQQALDELGEPTPLAATLRGVLRQLSRQFGEGDASLDAALGALDRAAEQVDEAESLLAAHLDAMDASPARLETIEDRLFSLRDAARKYRCGVDALHGLLEEARGKTGTLDSQMQRIGALHERIAQTRDAYIAAAERLSTAREKAARKLEKSMHQELKPLKMEKTRFAVAMTPLEEARWSANGKESICFEASTNPGMPLAPLSKIASGGELSRFMLAFKLALHETAGPATLIFDEIDTGTGGAVAEAIGQRLRALGDIRQVFAITHLPQVAALGHHHLHIRKTATAKRALTQVETLHGDTARNEELARMLAGAEITAEARKAAMRLRAHAE